MSASDFETVRAWLERKVPRDRDEALAALARIEEHYKYAMALPELEWARVCASITTRLATMARAGYQGDAQEMVKVLDAGKTYVTRLRADRQALAERVQGRIAGELRNRGHWDAYEVVGRLDLAPILEVPAPESER